MLMLGRRCGVGELRVVGGWAGVSARFVDFGVGGSGSWRNWVKG